MTIEEFDEVPRPPTKQEILSPNAGGRYTFEQQGPTGDHLVHNAEKWRIYVAKALDWVAPAFLLSPFGHLGINLLCLFYFLNSAVYQGSTAQSLGKQAVGITLAYESRKYWEHRTFYCVPGVIRCTIRLCCHFFDLLLPWGILRPLIYPQGRTYADSCVKTSLIRDKRMGPLWEVSEMRETRRAEK